MSTCQKQAHICSSSCAFCKRTPPHVISTELRRSLRPEEEWRDPEDVSAAMLIQGILTMLYPRNRISWHQFSVQILSAWIELINRENLPFPLPSITGSAPSDHAGPRHLNRTPKVPPRTSPLVISTELRRSLRSEEEWRDPEDVSAAMLMQGVLSKLPGCYPLPLRMRDGFYYKFWVYILSSRSGTLYVGITGYLNRRITQHKIDTIEGFTKKYQCHRLVYYESYQDVLVAIAREKQLKRWRREKKIALIEKLNPRWQDLAESWGREMRFRGQSLAKIP